MKNTMYYFLVLILLYCSCKPKENQNQELAKLEHSDSVHYQRVYPGFEDTVNLSPGLSSKVILGNIDGIARPYYPCHCTATNHNYQVLSIGETLNDELAPYRNQSIFVSTSNTSRANLITSFDNSLDTSYYESKRPVGKTGCSSICCNLKGNLDSFHFDNKAYLNLPFAYHDKINIVTHSIDTLYNVEFRISESDYNMFNDSLKLYKILECGADSADFGYLNVFKKRQTIPLFRINQVKE